MERNENGLPLDLSHNIFNNNKSSKSSGEVFDSHGKIDNYISKVTFYDKNKVDVLSFIPTFVYDTAGEEIPIGIG